MFISMLLLFLTGCNPEREIIFKNKSYNEVYNKTIQFVNLKGWSILYENSDAGVIKVVLRQFGGGTIKQGSINGNASEVGSNAYVTGSYQEQTMQLPVNKDCLIFIITSNRLEEVKVKIKSEIQSLVLWETEKNFSEYEDFIFEN